MTSPPPPKSVVPSVGSFFETSKTNPASLLSIDKSSDLPNQLFTTSIFSLSNLAALHSWSSFLY